MLGAKALERNTEFHCRAAWRFHKLVVLQLDDITVNAGNDTGYSAQLTGLVGKQYGYGEDTAFPTATKFDDITYDEVLKRGLKVMDLTATCMCKENNLPIIVFDMDTVGNLKKVMTGENIGTLVHN